MITTKLTSRKDMQSSFYQTKKSNIFFEQSKSNDGQRLIFIHNAGGNHAFMQKQSSYFSNQCLPVINLDLPGHGNSTTHDKFSFSIEDMAKEVACLIKDSSFNQATVVGLNYGGNVALQLAYDYPDLVSHIILLDPPILMAEWVKDLVREHINELKNPLIENFASNLVENVGLYMNNHDKQIAIEAFNIIHKTNLAKVYENLLIWDSDSHFKLKTLKTPILHIQSQNPFCEESTMKKLCPHVMTARVIGAGHWMTMEAPIQVNDMIQRFIDIKNN